MRHVIAQLGSLRARAAHRYATLRVLIRPLLAVLALAALLALPMDSLALTGADGHVRSSVASGHGARTTRGERSSRTRPHQAASRFLTGIGDEHTAMFHARLWKQLDFEITRYIVPYDVAAHRNELNEARTWIATALAAHQQILVAFYHSKQTPMGMPSSALYRRDVAKFLRLFPKVHQYQPWNEANRGNVPHFFASPNAQQSAIYYRELRSIAHHDTIVGLDLLDNPNVAPTLSYVAEFKADVRGLHAVMPQLWGLHNYSDTNSFQSSRTRAVLAAVPGDLWLTETGGVVKFGTALTNVHGSGLRRAARALEYMFHLAYISPRITRLYIYAWSGAGPRARFDAGLMDAHGHPRQGYVAVCDHRTHYSRRCRVHVSNH